MRHESAEPMNRPWWRRLWGKVLFHIPVYYSRFKQAESTIDAVLAFAERLFQRVGAATEKEREANDVEADGWLVFFYLCRRQYMHDACSFTESDE